MSRNREKVYKQGERINIYLSRDVTPEFVEWINMQSDLSNFFLYGAQQLYEKTGFIDVSEVMPRKINFELSSDDKKLHHQTKATEIIKEEISSPKKRKELDNKIVSQNNLLESKKETVNLDKEKDLWHDIENLDDDPFA